MCRHFLLFFHWDNREFIAAQPSIAIEAEIMDFETSADPQQRLHVTDAAAGKLICEAQLIFRNEQNCPRQESDGIFSVPAVQRKKKKPLERAAGRQSCKGSRRPSC